MKVYLNKTFSHLSTIFDTESFSWIFFAFSEIRFLHSALSAISFIAFTHASSPPTGIKKPLIPLSMTILAPPMGQSVQIEGSPNAMASIIELDIPS